MTDGVSPPTFAHMVSGVLTTPVDLWEVSTPLKSMLPPMTYAHLHLLPSRTSRFASRRQSVCFFHSRNGTINSWTKADRAGLELSAAMTSTELDVRLKKIDPYTMTAA